MQGSEQLQIEMMVNAINTLTKMLDDLTKRVAELERRDKRRLPGLG